MRTKGKGFTIVAAALAILVIAAVACQAVDVLVNQVGYERYAPKVFRAQRTTDYTGDGTFSVKRVSDNVTVSSGTLVRKGAAWNRFYWEGDFGSLTVDGDYYINAVVNGESANSYNFNIGNGTLLTRTGQPLCQYFQAQRCGQAVSLTYLNRSGQWVNWSHNSCHTDDGYIYSAGPQWDAVGGWHDAGDYGKYTHGFAGNPVFDLLYLYDTNRAYFDSIDQNSNGIADLLDEAIYQARWLAKMVQANGHVMEKMRQRRSGASWVKPENDTDRITGNSDDRWIDIGTESTPQETVVCAALARMHLVCASKGLPTENFASKALSIWDHRVAIAISEGGHNNLGSGAQHIWAGFDLYTIYGQQNCWDRSRQRIDEMIWNVNNNPGIYDDGYEAPGYELGVLCWFARNYPSDPYASGAISAAQILMDRNMNYLVGAPIGLIRRDEGGTLQYLPDNSALGNNRLLGFIAWGATEAYKVTGNASYLRFALDQFNWILGANYHRVCMMEAVGDYHLNKYHSRYDTFVTNGIEPGIVTNGYIRDAGGIPWVDFGTGSVSVQTNESWLPNSSAYAMALAGMAVFANNPQTPYSGVIALPGTIQAENYDNGGEGISYHDRTSGNTGGAYRTNDIDIEATGDTGGGYNVGWVEPGEWLEYTVNPDTTANYTINMRAANGSGTNCGFHILVNGQDVTGVTSIPDTGGWQTYGTVAIPNVPLNAGQQVLTVYFDSGSCNFNYVQVVGAPDTTAPGPVTSFIATAGNGQNGLTWANPGDSDFAGTMIRWSTITYPGSPTGGTQCYNGTGTSTTHSGLQNGVTYYYSAFTYDEVPNYSGPALASATPVLTYCYENLFAYSNGNLNGNGGWAGSATSEIVVENQTVRINGGAVIKDAARTVSCADTGSGYILVSSKIKSGVGDTTMWSLYIDDTVGANLARWYGAGTTARGRIGGTADVTATQTLTGGWDELKVKITPSANTSEFFFNGVSIGVLNHASQGANDVVGRLRFERSDNSGAAGHYLFFDDLRIGEVDTTPPGPVTNFVVTPGDTQNSLSWTNPGSDFAGTMVRWSTTSYPGSPTGGTLLYQASGTSTTHTGLTNGVTYYYSAFAYDSVPNYSGAATASGAPGDTTAPGNVTGFTATSGDTQISLSWANPGDADFAGVKIMFKTTGYPTGPTDGTQCYNSNGTSYVHTGLTNGVTYYYKAFAYDEVPNYASGAQASAVPADVTPPSPVTGFTATPSGTQNALAWTNPGGDFTGTKIMWKTTGYPTGPTDGTQCYDSSGTTYAHTGLTAGVTYYYCAYAHDEVPNYAGAAQASGTIPSAFCFQDEFIYTTGALVGQGGWTGTATSAHITVTDSDVVEVFGGSVAKNAVKTMTCSGGPYIWVRMNALAGTGATTMWNVWINDSGGKNFARWYGAGTTARGRIGTSGTVTAVQTLRGGGLWDSLVVKIDPAANTTQFYFNGADLGVYSHGTQPNSVVSEIKIERENNGGAAGHYMFLDDIRVSQT